MNDRVPPGQHLVSGFPVLHVGPVPPFDPKTWRLRVFGLVAEERSYTYAELTSGTLLPLTTVQTDFHCVTTWSKLDNIWEGVKFIDLLAQMRLQPGARYVMAHCAHGYTTNIPLADLKRDDVLLAWRHNGADLSPEHGSPYACWCHTCMAGRAPNGYAAWSSWPRMLQVFGNNAGIICTVIPGTSNATPGIEVRGAAPDSRG